MASDFRPVGVIGASGQLGQNIVKCLLENLKVPPKEIIAISRSPDKLADLSKRGVQVRKGDFNDTASLKAAFAGVKRLVVISGDDFQNRLNQHKAAFAEAAGAGVKHVIYAGAVSPATGTNAPAWIEDHYQTDKALSETKGISWTVIGCNFWEEVHIAPYTIAAKTGTFWTTKKSAKVAYVSREDCALACATILASNSTKSEKFNISGPEALDREQVSALVSKALNKPIKVEEVSEADMRKNLLAAQVPENFVGFIVLVDTGFATGFLGQVTNDFKKIVGKEPEKVSAWVERNKATLGK